MKYAWKKYAADFKVMTDDEIDEETNRCHDELEKAEDWLEAVASWEAAGRPR